MSIAELRSRIAIAREQAAGRDSPGFVVLTADEAEDLAQLLEATHDRAIEAEARR